MRRSDGGVKALIAILVVLIVLAIAFGVFEWFASQWNGA
jgi:hypothetical protein